MTSGFAVGPGSSERDYDAVGVLFEERWERFDEPSRFCAPLPILLRVKAAMTPAWPE